MDRIEPTGGAHAFGDVGTPDVIAVIVNVVLAKVVAVKAIALMTTGTGA
jgi:hypothetical protein